MITTTSNNKLFLTLITPIINAVIGIRIELVSSRVISITSQ